MMPRRVYCLVLLWIIFSSFFWSEEEKDVNVIAQQGEAAMQSNELLKAKDLFKQVLELASVGEEGKTYLSWVKLIKYSMHLARVYELLDQKEEGVKTLNALLNRDPPEALRPKILLMKARLSAPQSSPEKSYLMLAQIAQMLPMEHWSKEDLAFYHLLSYSLDDYFDSQLKKAKRYFVTGYFEEAIALYEEVLASISHNSFPKANLNPDLIEKKIRYALAECYFSKADYEKTLSYVEEDAAKDGKIEREMLYLMALCYKHLHEYEKSIALLEDYAGGGESEGLAHYDHALFEIGYHYYAHGQKDKASHYFQVLSDFSKNLGKPKLVAGLYLARIALEQQETEKASDRLERLSSQINQKNPLFQELSFLKGEVAYLKEEYDEARAAYEMACPTVDGEGWHAHAFYKLGWCHLQLATLTKEKAPHFERAEGQFKRLLETKDGPRAALSLGRLYLLRSVHLQDTSKLEELSPLFAQFGQIFTLQEQHEALLLRAEGALDPKKKGQLLTLATAEQYKRLPTYLNAWYERGVNAFQIGIYQDESAFKEATLSFEKAFELCQNQKTALAAKILKLNAKTHLYQQSPEISLELLEELLTSYIETREERAETLYLRGLIASRFTDNHQVALAIDSLEKLLEDYPQSTYKAEALHILATLYFEKEAFAKAHTLFLELAQTHSPLAPQGWFWGAEALASLDATHPQVSVYRQTVYESFPDSEKAPEAYFRLFPYKDYADGESEALEHLASFSTRFPNSPLRLMAHYLIGIHLEEPEAAIATFQEAIKLLPQLTAEGELPCVNTIHFYYESLHKLAILYLQDHKTAGKGVALLKSVIDDYNEADHPLMSLLKEQSPVPDEFAGAAYTLAKAYLDQQKRTKAEQLFFSLLMEYREAAITDNLYLSLSWREQARLAVQDQNFETALNCLDVAEDSGRMSLTDEQKLRLWLLKSDCCREMGDLKRSMRLLSKIINSDVISPLRIKAMFLRAEIYEEQGRPELATRQLEALVKKGGEWAKRAENELRRLGA